MDHCPICRAPIQEHCACGMNHSVCVHGHEFHIDGGGELQSGPPDGCNVDDTEHTEITVASDDAQGVVQMRFPQPIQFFDVSPRTAMEIAFHLLNHAFKVQHNRLNAYEKDNGEGGGV